MFHGWGGLVIEGGRPGPDRPPTQTTCNHVIRTEQTRPELLPRGHACSRLPVCGQGHFYLLHLLFFRLLLGAARLAQGGRALCQRHMGNEPTGIAPTQLSAIPRPQPEPARRMAPHNNKHARHNTPRTSAAPSPPVACVCSASFFCAMA